jgi:type I restriction enzyme, S subunit
MAKYSGAPFSGKELECSAFATIVQATRLDSASLNVASKGNVERQGVELMNWQTVKVSQALRKARVGRENQIPASEIMPTGKYPVVDQGQTFIAGYSNQDTRVVRFDLPLVVFGDHTRCVKFVDFPFILGADGTKVLKPREELFDAQFFAFALQNLDLPSRGYNRHFTLLKERDLPCPPLPEQRKIATLLGVVQRALEQQERLLQLTTELKNTLLHQLFTRGLRGEPQKQTEIGPVPESWEAATLGQLACKPSGFLQTGPFGSQLHKHDYLDEGVGVVNPTHLWGNRINKEDVPRVSAEVAARLERHRLEDGDILFARRGEIGRHGMVTKDQDGWLCGTGCFLARVRQKHIDNRFLSYLFSTPGVIAWLNSHAAGAIMPNLNNTVLRSMPVFVPKVDLQGEIANCLDAAEHKMMIQERKKQVLADLFRIFLHQLMTAQIRVHNLEVPEFEAEMEE